MTNYLLSIDPGWSSGAALLAWNEGTPAFLCAAWQFTGGLVSLRNWIEDSHSPHREDVPGVDWWTFEEMPYPLGNVRVISEKFTPRPNEKFGLTLKSVEPLRCEGVLVDRGLLPDYDPKIKEWRQPKDQYIVGGKDLTDKKKRQHAFLKDSGFYVTNKMFPDSPPKDQADDARSAIAHGLGYLARVVKHEPTFKVLSEWSESNGS